MISPLKIRNMVNGLPENFFRTHGSVILPGIDETVKLPRDVWYRDVGAVPSLAENLAKTQLITRGIIDSNRNHFQRILEWPMDALVMMLAKDNFRQKNPNVDEMIAYCTELKIPHFQVRAFELATKQAPDISTGIFASGYASGEFLRAIKQEQTLYDALDRENIGRPTAYRSSASSPRFEGKEFADAAGLLSLLKASRAGIENIHVPTFRHRPEIQPYQTKAFGL